MKIDQHLLQVREFFAITTEVASESNPEDEAKQEDDGDHDNEDDEDSDDRLSPRVIRRKQRAEKIQASLMIGLSRF